MRSSESGVSISSDSTTRNKDLDSILIGVDIVRFSDGVNGELKVLVGDRSVLTFGYVLQDT